MRNRERRLPLPPVDIITVLLCTVAVFFVVAFGGKALEGYRLQRHNAVLREHVAAAEQEMAELQARLEYVQKPEYAERIAREQYKWTRPGEKLIIPVYETDAEVLTAPGRSQAGASGDTVGASSFWAEWWNLLMGAFD